MDYDKTNLPDAYARSRKLSPETARLWMDVVAEFLPSGGRALSILDLGCGTGRFAPLLAERFGAKVVGVEPSEKMRTQAVENASHPRVTYLAGSAEAIPCDDASFDAAFLSMVMHHFRSIPDACLELHRVLRQGGLVFIRNSFRDRLDSVRYLDFFPSGKAADNTRLCGVDEVIASFQAEGFTLLFRRAISQQIDLSLRTHYERVKLKGLSTFEYISEEEFRTGIETMRKAAEAETEPSPIVEDIDFLVFRISLKEGSDG